MDRKLAIYIFASFITSPFIMSNMHTVAKHGYCAVHTNIIKKWILFVLDSELSTLKFFDNILGEC